MMDAKTDSEATSLAPSSPPRSPRRPVYYVQSPSHDGEKTNVTSFHSTPVISPVGSPPHSNSSVGIHSRESSSTRFSGTLKSHHAGGSSKISPNDVVDGKGTKRDKKKQRDFEVIEEEGLLKDEDEKRGIPRRCYYVAFVGGFVVLFTFFALVLWGASKNQEPHLTVKSIKFENFKVQAGSDSTGVPTDMASLNSTVKFTFRNTGTFFGLHVSSSPLQLSYAQLALASGDMDNFYQRRKSQRNVVVVVQSNRIPLYGVSSSFIVGDGKGGRKQQKVPLRLAFKLRSRAYVLGKLVKTKFYIDVACSVVLDPDKLDVPVRLKNCKGN